MAPLLHPPVPGLPVLGDLQANLEPRQRPLVGEQTGVVVVHRAGVDRLVGVPEQARVVAARPGLEGDVGEAGVERRAVEHHPVGVLVGAGQQAGPAGGARRGLAVVGGEPHPVGGEGVQVRRPHQRMAGRPEAVGPPLVDGDEQQVRAC